MTDAAAKLTVLLVEDTLSLARTYEKYLRDQPYDLVHVETGGAALQALERNAPDAVLLDLMLPDLNGLEILRHIAEQGGRTAVVVIAARRSIATAVEAMRLGAFDFLVKPFSAERLGVTLRNALERQRLTRIVETYKNDFNREEYCGFIGSSLPMQALYRIVDSAAGSKATVFITGESGTGKEICAEAIHCQSPRIEKPFIVLNCGAIPKDLLESEIFGHVKGAFTGAVSEREGAASRANGGTLFLDEVCELAPNLQTKLLRFVQTGTFQKVGGSKTEDVDIRFVCATDSDPVREVARGRFREDLSDISQIARQIHGNHTQIAAAVVMAFPPQPSDSLILVSWPSPGRPFSHDFPPSQAYLSRTFHLAVDSLGLRRNGFSVVDHQSGSGFSGTVPSAPPPRLIGT